MMESVMEPETAMTQSDGRTIVPLRIKGMVCDRCIGVVHSELAQAGFHVLNIQLGQLTLRGPLSAVDTEKIKALLTKQGFSLIEETKQSIHQRVKVLIDTYFAQDDLSENKSRLSTQLQETLDLDYDTISGQFTKAEGITLEKYIILRRINKVKEWLVYSDLTLTEIAHRTGYSSVQHLSNQFRQQTGLTPSYFRQVRQEKKSLQHGAEKLAVPIGIEQ
ncbi:AraC-like DNA-binding protein [Spirosoma lacussanchae]|uniref:helix-turn-helix domain-containing protein n=1 Tax=Spirosoma lacussanchae TaxID=1884249 RepID=UPI003D2230B2